jgi:polar amino acid transport system substrate-binding protein
MKKSVFKVLVVLVMVAGMVGLLATCAQAPKEEAEVVQDNLIDRIVKRGVLKVGLDIFVPWSFKDKDGNMVGFEVDVATQLAEDMGVDVEFVPTEWSGIIPALLTGKFDVIIGGMGITTERALKVNYSIPYEYSGMDCVVNRAMLPGADSLEDLNKENIIIAVRMGGTPTAAAKKFTPKAQLHQFDSDEAVIQDVLNGNAHAAYSSSPKPAYWAVDYADKVYRPLKGELFTSEPCGFVVPKGDPDSVFFFNAWITDKQDWLKDKSDYWYGTKDWEYLLPE